MPIALPFFRINQLLIVAQFGAKPPMFAPSDTMNVQVTINIKRLLANNPKQISPNPINAIPTKIGPRDPYLSMKYPTMGARTVFSARAIEMASEVRNALNPNA